MFPRFEFVGVRNGLLASTVFELWVRKRLSNQTARRGAT